MGNLAQFGIGGYVPQGSNIIPNNIPNQPSSVQPPKNALTNKIGELGKRIDDLAAKDGMKPDDPLRIIHNEISKEIDEIKATQKRLSEALKAFGPDSGRLAADSAAAIMRQNMGRMFKHMRAGLLAVGLLGAAGLVGVGAWGGWAVRGAVATQIGNASIPREMAERFPYQNWQAQWQNRQTLPADKSGFVWAWVPMVETMPKPPKR